MISVPVSEVLFPDPVPAGMNPLVLMSLAYAMRTSAAWPATVPPVILAELDGGFWRIVDGRHRVVAAMMAGYLAVVAELVDAPDSRSGAPGRA